MSGSIDEYLKEYFYRTLLPNSEYKPIIFSKYLKFKNYVECCDKAAFMRILEDRRTRASNKSDILSDLIYAYDNFIIHLVRDTPLDVNLLRQ